MKRVYILLLLLLFACSKNEYVSQDLYKEGIITKNEEVRIFTGQDESVEGIALSPDGTALASAGIGKTVVIWNAANGKMLRTFKVSDEVVNSLDFSTDGTVLATGGNDFTVKLWGIKDGKLIKELGSHTLRVTSVAFSPRGYIVASAGFDSAIKIWDIKTGVLYTELKGHDKPINKISFSSDGKYLASCSTDKTVRIWDMDLFSPVAVLREHTDNVESVAFSPDGRYVASTGKDKTIHVWVNENGRFSHLQVMSGNTMPIRSLVFTRDSRYLISGGYDGAVKLWTVLDGREVAVLQNQASWIRDVMVSRDGRYVISACVNGSVKSSRLPQIQFYSYAVTPIKVKLSGDVEAIFPAGKLLKTGGEKVQLIYNGAETDADLIDGKVAPLYSTLDAVVLTDDVGLSASPDLASLEVTMPRGTIIKAGNVMYTENRLLANVTYDKHNGWIKGNSNLTRLSRVSRETALTAYSADVLKSPDGQKAATIGFGTDISLIYYSPELHYYYIESRGVSGWLDKKYITQK